MQADLPAGEDFGVALMQPAVEVRVGGTPLYVHRHVLQKISLFAEMLDGSWIDAQAPTVNLPCSVNEFSLILRRMYTGEPFGSSALPVPDCPSALRLGAAAAMLLIDDQLPELQHVLRATIVTTEDVELARQAAGALPGTLGAALHDLCASNTDLPFDLKALVFNSRSESARTITKKVLTANRGRLCSGHLFEAAKQVMQTADDDVGDIKWAAYIAENYLSCEFATKVFQAYWNVEYWPSVCAPRCSLHPASARLIGLREAFAEHLVRCARAGCVMEPFGLICGSSDYSKYWRCVNMSPYPLYFGSKEADALVAVVRAAPHEQTAIV